MGYVGLAALVALATPACGGGDEVDEEIATIEAAVDCVDATWSEQWCEGCAYTCWFQQCGSDPGRTQCSGHETCVKLCGEQ